MLKRILLVIGFFGIIGLVAFAIYSVFFRAPTPTVVTPSVAPDEITGIIPGLPTAELGAPRAAPSEIDSRALPVSEIASGGITKTTRLTSSNVKATTLSANGKNISFYDPADGKFYTVGPDGEIELLSESRFPNAETIVWNDDSNKVVIEFPDGANIIYDFTSGAQTTLPSHWEEFDFSADGEQVIAKSLGVDPNSRSIVITNVDGSNARAVANLGNNERNTTINWSPNNQVIGFTDTNRTPSGFGRHMILPIGQNRENFKGLIIEGINFNAIWSPDGKRILYDTTGSISKFKPMLWIVDGTPAKMGDNRQSLGVNTWIDKCTFSTNTIVYCAVPQLMINDGGLQRELIDTNDSISRIDLRTGRVTFIGVPEITTRMSNLTVSDDERYLYFQDFAGRVQSMRLK